MYYTIRNPLNNIDYPINSRLGKRILKNYIYFLNGGSGQAKKYVITNNPSIRRGMGGTGWTQREPIIISVDGVEQKPLTNAEIEQFVKLVNKKHETIKNIEDAVHSALKEVIVDREELELKQALFLAELELSDEQLKEIAQVSKLYYDHLKHTNPDITEEHTDLAGLNLTFEGMRYSNDISKEYNRQKHFNYPI